MCEDTSIKGVHVFEAAKKEYDQAINRNAEAMAKQVQILPDPFGL